MGHPAKQTTESTEKQREHRGIRGDLGRLMILTHFKRNLHGFFMPKLRGSGYSSDLHSKLTLAAH